MPRNKGSFTDKKHNEKTSSCPGEGPDVGPEVGSTANPAFEASLPALPQMGWAVSTCYPRRSPGGWFCCAERRT